MCVPPLIPLDQSRTTSDMPRHRPREVILRDASVTSRGCDFDIIGCIVHNNASSGLCLPNAETHRSFETLCEGVSSRQSIAHNSFAAGRLCSTIQGFLSITIELFKRSCSLCDDFPPLLRRCCAYLKPSLLGSCRAATAHLSLRHGSQNTQQQWVGDVWESGSRVTHRDYQDTR